jgi:hypothetical protein
MKGLINEWWIGRCLEGSSHGLILRCYWQVGYKLQLQASNLFSKVSGIPWGLCSIMTVNSSTLHCTAIDSIASCPLFRCCSLRSHHSTAPTKDSASPTPSRECSCRFWNNCGGFHQDPVRYQATYRSCHTPPRRLARRSARLSQTLWVLRCGTVWQHL